MLNKSDLQALAQAIKNEAAELESLFGGEVGLRPVAAGEAAVQLSKTQEALKKLVRAVAASWRPARDPSASE